MLATYVVPAANRARIEEKLAELNRKAKRLGITPATIAFSHNRTDKKRVPLFPDRPETWETKFRVIETVWLNAELQGEPVVVAGYEFIGTIHHTTDGNILAAVPGRDFPLEFRNAPATCDHCKTSRRRNATYVVQSLTESSQPLLRRVGNSCLQDFFGRDPHKMVKWAEYLGAFNSWFQTQYDEDGNPISSGYVEPVWSLGEFIAATAAVIRVDGWVSKSAARDSDRTPTAYTVDRLLTMQVKTFEDRKFQESFVRTPEDEALTADVLAYLESLEDRADDQKNDYEHNLSVVSRAGLVNRKTAGIAASAIVAYRKAAGKLEERKQAEKAGTSSEWQGKPAERLRNIPVKVQVRDLPPNDFGSRQLVTMTDAKGNVFAWFTGTMGGFRATDNWHNMTATVKRHSEYKGVKQTEVTRCVLGI